MGRDNFLRRLKEFDDNYCLGCESSEDEKNYFMNEASREGKTLKEYLSEKKVLQWYSQINYKKIEQITINSDNPFTHFYKLDDLFFEIFAYNLHKTSLFLKYYEDRHFDRLRTYKARQSLQKKYKKIIEDLILIETDEKIIEVLKNRMNGLSIQPTITERRIFENLLYAIMVCLGDSRDEKINLTKKIADIANKIIKDYYNKDYIFSKNTSVHTFTEYHYTVETAHAIILSHSSPA